MLKFIKNLTTLGVILFLVIGSVVLYFSLNILGIILSIIGGPVILGILGLIIIICFIYEKFIGDSNE